MSRIDPDRDVVIVPEKESLPSAIAERSGKYTHAYPDGFRMDRGSVKIFGPQKAQAPQRVAVLTKNSDTEQVITNARITSDDQLVLPNGQTRAASSAGSYTHAYPEDFRMRLTTSLGSDVKIIGPRKSSQPARAVVTAKDTETETARARATLTAIVAKHADVLAARVEETARSWADVEEDEDQPQHVLVGTRG